MRPPAIPPILLRPWPQTLLLIVLVLACLLPAIGQPTGITGKDEFYLGLRTPMEMMAGDHWLVPFLDDAPRIKKPPLLYWVGRLAFEIGGTSLVSARFAATLFAALLVVAGAGIARRLSGNPQDGLIVGAILLGCLGLHSEGRRFMLDVPVAALSTAAFWAWLIWWDGKRWPWLSLAALLLGLGILCKGPVALIVLGAGIAACLLTGRIPCTALRGVWPSLLANGLLALAVALPWFLVVRHLYPEAAQIALADELESRQFFNLTPGIILGLLNIALPWGFVFITAAWWARRQTGLPRFLLLWFLLTFLPFLFLRSFDRYLVGSLVPLAIFLTTITTTFPYRWPYRLGATLAALLALGLAGFAFWFHREGWWWPLLPAAYLLWAWWHQPFTPHRLAAPALLWLAVLGGLFPALGINHVPPGVIELGKTRTIALFDGPQPAMLPILSAQAHRHYPRLDRFDASELIALNALVFAESGDTASLGSQLLDSGVELVAEGHYLTLASHGSGLRFARVGATTADWKAALHTRDLTPLMTRIEWFSLRHRP